MTMESTVPSRYPSAAAASVHVPSEGALTSNEPSEPVAPDTDEEPSDSVTVESATGAPSVERTVPGHMAQRRPGLVDGPVRGLAVGDQAVVPRLVAVKALQILGRGVGGGRWGIRWNNPLSKPMCRR